MEIGYTPEQEAMRTELRAYYEKLLDPATVAELVESHAIGEPRRHRAGHHTGDPSDEDALARERRRVHRGSPFVERANDRRAGPP